MRVSGVSRRHWLKTAGLVVAASQAHQVALLSATAESPIRELSPWRLYAFDNGLNGPDVPTLASKAALLKKLGYCGMTDHFNLNRLPAVLDILDRHELEFSSFYYTPAVESPVDPRLRDCIKLLARRRTRIEIGFTSKQYKPSDPAADSKALDFLKQVADWVGDTGPLISIYPHKGFWTERVEDGVRLAQKSGLKTVGTNFNLIHYVWTTPARELGTLLREALPYLKLVTVNGIAGTAIVSLADGDYDVAQFLAAVKHAGYVGPIGLQCYSIKGESEAHLTRSMNKWKLMRESLKL